MKYNIVFLVLVVSFTFKVNAQDKFERFSLNFGLYHPILNEYRYVNLKYAVDPEIEALLNFRLKGKIKLSTGFGFHYGEHAVIEGEDVRKNNVLYKEDNYSDLAINFLSVETPLYITTPINSSFLDSYFVGIRFGWLCKYNISEGIERNIPDEEINRLFLDYCLGLSKELFQFNNISIDLSPFFGYRGYLSDRNNWQNNFLFYGMKFCVGF